MRRVLVVTWALGTASGVLLGLFGVQLVSSRFSTSRVSPLSHPEVLRALQAARNVPVIADAEVALPAPSPDTAGPPSPPTDGAPARPQAGATSPAQSPPASTLPRPGPPAGTLVNPVAGPAGVPPTTSTVAPPAAPSSSSTTTTTAQPTGSTTKKNGKKSEASSTTSSTTTTTTRNTTTTTAPPPKSNSSSPTTISCPGGVVTVRYYDGKVQLKAARPNSGYYVYTPEQRSPDEVVVYFLTKDVTYIVRAFYKDGQPAYDVQRRSNR